MNLTEPGSCAFMPASTSAVAMRIATCVSCPQACITSTSLPRNWPLAFDANGTSTRSFTGSASMSARKATTGPGEAPLSRPTTPVLATPVFTSRPSRRRWSATSLAVRVS